MDKRFEWALLAMEAAVRRDGLLDITAGGYDSVTLPSFSVPGRIVAATSIRVDNSDPLELELVMEIVAPSGAVIATRRDRFLTDSTNLLPGEASRTSVVMEHDRVDFEETGRHIVRLMCDDDVAELDVTVRPLG